MKVPWERLGVAVAGLGGLALAVPTIGSPTWRMAVSDPGRGAVLATQTTWSWGKVVVTGRVTGEVVSETVVTNVPGLVGLVGMLVVGFVGLVLWVVLPGVRGAVAGLVGGAVAASALVTATLQRLGQAARVDAYRTTGLDVRSYPQSAAVYETLSALVLVATLAAVAWMTLHSGSGPSAPAPVLGSRATATADSEMAGSEMAGSEVAGSEGAGSVGAAGSEGADSGAGGAERSVVDGPAGAARLEPRDRTRHLSGEAVSFSEAPRPDPSEPPHPDPDR
ncbi:hypothetical protein N865_19360 [Intrasporangium oryzae NRRL B-24470]|uniref:Uncharacterized protein n=1 Tax=Intrasporangium oryzae NRRL B-24470 TaxID=1386089 RepID=W9G1R5_9MICO|nr:hypothetical protein [Intrasporangium oryzae]EWT00006.1 hypothetical protein N865_19360 [Intrasporangium oryzae NRRL B-24470]